MKFLRKTELKSEKYTWLYKLKYTFYISLVAMATLFLYTLCLELFTNTAITKVHFFDIYKENFYLASFNTQLFPHILFYLFFEELAFRKSLKVSSKNLIITLPMLLFLCGQSFINESYYLFIYGLYALGLIIIFKKGYTSKLAQLINLTLSLLALGTFHLSKFTTEKSDAFELLFNHLIPILIIGIVLAHLRVKFDSYTSVFLYFLVVLVANIW